MELDDVLDLADRAVARLECGQALVRWDGALSVVLVAVVDGRCGRAETDDPGGIERAARAAALHARRARAWPAPELPGPVTGVRRCGAGVREAVANTRGTRVAQEYAVRVPEVEPPRPDGDPRVIAPQVVAAALAGLRSAAFGVGRVLGGPPPALAPCIALADDSAVGLPRAYDVEGVPRRRVALVEAGAIVGAVHDSSSQAPSTGHATRPLTLAPRPDHLVLAPGAEDLGPPGDRPAVDLREVEAVGREPVLVGLPGGGCALVPAVRVAG